MSRKPARARRTTVAWMIATAAVVALVTAACGGGGNSTVTAAPTSGSGGATTTAANGNGGSSDGGDVAEGEKVYKAQCASCHGATGKEGGVGPAMTTVKTVFPEEKDHIEWVKSKAAATSGSYGANNSGNAGKGATVGAMPKYEGTLSDEEIANVVAYERSLAK